MKLRSEIPAEDQDGLVFACETMSECLDETKFLHADHWKETEGYRDEQGYEPDYEQFALIERNGNFAYFTARRDGQLIGHLGYVIHKSRHTSKRAASEDFFYFLPAERRGFVSIKFLRYVVRVLTACGCREIGMSSKLTNDIEPLLKRVGFKYVAKFYIMNVGGNQNVL